MTTKRGNIKIILPNYIFFIFQGSAFDSLKASIPKNLMNCSFLQQTFQKNLGQ